MAVALSAIARRPIVYVPVSPEDFQNNLANAAPPDWRAFDLAHIASAYTSIDCRVSPDFEALVGHDPTSIETFFKDYKNFFDA